MRRDVQQWRGAGEDLPMPAAADAVSGLFWLMAAALAIGIVLAGRKDYESAPKE